MPYMSSNVSDGTRAVCVTSAALSGTFQCWAFLAGGGRLQHWPATIFSEKKWSFDSLSPSHTLSLALVLIEST